MYLLRKRGSESKLKKIPLNAAWTHEFLAYQDNLSTPFNLPNTSSQVNPKNARLTFFGGMYIQSCKAKRLNLNQARGKMDSCFMPKESNKLSRIQAETLEAVIDLTLKDGCPPTITHARRELERDIRGTIAFLKSEGYLHQAYTHGPYVPAKDVQGRDLQLTVLPKDIAQRAESEAYRRK